jgi:hypothetical protein
MPSFEHVEATFWDATIEHGVLPPLTQDMLAVAKRELGVKLPDDLLRLLRIQNGGVVADAWDACPAEANFYADDHVPFDHVFGLGPAGTPGITTLLDTAYLVAADFIVEGRPAPGIGANRGGGIEVVVPPGGVDVDWFSAQ